MFGSAVRNGSLSLRSGAQARASSGAARLAWLAVLALCAACGKERGATGEPGDADSGAADAGELEIDDAGAAEDSSTGAGFTLSAPSTELVLRAMPYPTVTFAFQDDGKPVEGGTYTIDRADLGSIDPKTGVFTPSGAAGAIVINASLGKDSAHTTLVIRVALTQEGDPDGDKMPEGAGGVGGVGGEGSGTPISDTALRAGLDATAMEDAALSWLYPYDGTVWPRGLAAPLLSWRAGSTAPLAVRIHLEVGDGYRYDGYFGAPKTLMAGKPITHLPLPQAVWRAALLSGSEMRVSLTVVGRDAGGTIKTYKPTKALNWKIAPGSLKGTVYYNSYGTKLAENFSGAVGGNGRFGGATLAVRGDSFDPLLIAGSTTSDDSGCRVCHTVSGNGAVLMVQKGRNLATSVYDLTSMNRETARPGADDGKFGWAALSPDASIALGNSGPPGSNGENVASLGQSFLYDVSSGAQLTANGFSEFVTRAATPSFAPAGDMVAFNFFAGNGSVGLMGNGQSLVLMKLARNDASTYTFSEPKAVYTSATTPPAWPSFLPDGMGLVFQRELAMGANNERFATRKGARGDLWWTDLNGEAHALDRANGSMSLPRGTAHPDDETLQYEPAVGPIVAGGYAWVVFTSRRMYGDVATRAPFDSDPRSADLTNKSSDGPTPKKLWVFAIDMPPKPGTDPSHPAFYLPAQELYAGNSRGFWVPDVCKQKGVGCTSGDECCGGFCRASDEFGKAICTDKLPPNSCSAEYDACETAADCCKGGAPLSCLGGRCSQIVIN
jgi:hypothetical protein